MKKYVKRVSIHAGSNIQLEVRQSDDELIVFASLKDVAKSPKSSKPLALPYTSSDFEPDEPAVPNVKTKKITNPCIVCPDQEADCSDCHTMSCPVNTGACDYDDYGN